MAFLQACLGGPHTTAAQKTLAEFLGLFSSAPSWALSLTLHLQLWWALLGQAELGSPSRGSGHGPWTRCTRLCSGLPLALTGRLVERRMHDQWLCLLNHGHTTRLVLTWWGHWDQGSPEYHNDVFKMVCVPLQRPAPGASRRRFLNCGYKSLVDLENNFVGYSYHLEREWSTVV